MRGDGLVYMNDKDRFMSLCEGIHREGIRDLMAWLEESDFYICPASTRYHGAQRSGLLKHSLNVYDELKRLLNTYSEIVVDEESVLIASLFHDLCKVNTYTTEQRNRKNENGQWEKYDAYVRSEKLRFGGHGSKSLFLVQHFIDLTPEEAVAINCHMSSWEGNNDAGDAFEQFPFAWLVHVADEAATYIREKR